MNNAKNILQPTLAPLSMGILVLPDSNTLSLAAAVDPFRATNRRASQKLFDWRFHTAQDSNVPLTSGLSVDANPLNTFNGDMLIIVAGFNLRAHCTPRLLAQLRQISNSGATLCGVDGGSWIMATAGILDGHIATCHWEDQEDFSQTFPQVHLVPDRYTISGSLWTTGGATPCIDLMLHLIATRYGKRLSERVASAFIYDQVQTGDSPQRRISTARIARKHPRIAGVLEIMDASLENPPNNAQLAKSIGVSTRKLELEFKSAIGQTPGSYFLDLRLTEARRRAIDTSASVQDIAIATGFGSQSSLARAFRAAFGQSITSLRSQQT